MENTVLLCCVRGEEENVEEGDEEDETKEGKRKERAGFVARSGAYVCAPSFPRLLILQATQSLLPKEKHQLDFLQQ